MKEGGAHVHAIERRTFRAWYSALGLLGGAAVAVAAIGWLASWTSYGFDFTDEGFYLNWIRDPYLYDISVTQFGFFYHWLLRPFINDVAALRQANLALTLGCAWLFGYVLFRSRSGTSRLRAWDAALLALPLSCTALLQTWNWLLTPSYNWLNLQGLLVVATALLLIGSSSSRAALAGWVLLAGGGWLSFLAKPTSAALVAIVSVAYLVLTRQAKPARLALAVGLCGALALATALLIDGSPYRFAIRIADGAALAGTLNNRYLPSNILRFSLPHFAVWEWTLLLATTIAVATAVVLCGSRRQTNAALGVVVTAGMVAIPILQVDLPIQTTSAMRLSLQVLAVPFGALLALLYLFVRGRLVAPHWQPALLSMVLAWFPYISTFGTSSDYWLRSGAAGVFWVASALILLRAVRRKTPALACFPIAMSAFAITLAVLTVGMEHPYRQPQPLYLNDKTVAVGEASLALTPEFASYLKNTRELIAAAGFKPGAPLIDLTGHYPGLLYALGAKAVGLAWMIGGYDGSEQLARTALSRVACGELISSWLLTEPGGPRALPKSVLGDFRVKYEIAGSLQPPGDGDAQYLLRPIGGMEQATATCERARHRR